MKGTQCEVREFPNVGLPCQLPLESVSSWQCIGIFSNQEADWSHGVQVSLEFQCVGVIEKLAMWLNSVFGPIHTPWRLDWPKAPTL